MPSGQPLLVMLAADELQMQHPLASPCTREALPDSMNDLLLAAPLQALFSSYKYFMSWAWVVAFQAP